MMNNPLPLLTPDADLQRFAAFPPHALDQHGTCIFCEEQPYANWRTFAEYEAWWLENEYEGDPNHDIGTTEAEWNYLAVSCMAEVD